MALTMARLWPNKKHDQMCNVSCLKAYSETDLILSSHYEASAMIPLSVVKEMSLIGGSVFRIMSISD